MKVLFLFASTCLVIASGTCEAATSKTGSGDLGRSSVQAGTAGSGAVQGAQQSTRTSGAQQGTAESSDRAIEEVVVTGSRIVRDGSSAPTPVTVLSADYLDERGVVNVADVLNELPMFRNSLTNQSQSSQVNRVGVNFLNLRSLGTSRTLVLINGMRHVPTGDLGELDLNLIPAILVDRLDVVTGGASATYGSDAVAGVVNVNLKRDVDYTKLDFQVGQSKYSDSEQSRVALLTGGGFANERGEVVLALEYYHNDGIGDMYERPWGTDEWGLLVNPDPASNGLPLRLISPNARNATIHPNGIITSGPLRGTKFLDDGTPAAFQYGELVGTQYMQGGEGFGQRWHKHQLYGSELERRLAYLRTSYQLTGETEVYADVSYGWKEADTAVAAGFNFGNITIQRDNAYLHPEIAAAMDSNGVSTFSMGRAWFDVGGNFPYQKDEVRRAVAGVTGALGENWNWDLNLAYGENEQDHGVRNAFIFTRSQLALDAVRAPDNSIVCRSSLADPGNGCVPFNPFGYAQASAEAFEWLRGHQHQAVTTQQTHANVNIAGAPFELWAGPLDLAAGIEYRKEELDADADPLGIVNSFQFGNYKPLHGSYDTNEVYVEAETPIVESVSVNGAARYTDYSTSGGVTTWKVGLAWEVNEQLRFRATNSRDIRAPGIPELFAPARAASPTLIIDPEQNNDFYFTSTTISGNSRLVPEEADTFTAGVIYQPRWAQGLLFSLDYYDIDLQDAISTIPVQDMVTRCSLGETSLCPFITRDASGRVINIAQTNINVAQFTTRGVDVELGYTTDVGPGTMTGRLFATRVLEQEQSDGVRVTDLLGQYNNPKLTISGSLDYEVGQLSMTAHGRYDDGGNFNNLWVEGVDIDDNSVGSVFYLNLSAEYGFGKSIDGESQYQVYGVINNALDEHPQPTPQQIFVVNPFTYDMVGRWYGVGLRVRF